MEPGAAKSALSTELRGKLPAVAEHLSAEEISDLAAAISEAKVAQERELSDAADTALQNVPRLLRGTAKRVLLG